jgi:sugar/nucleoside kinase (ribokinase family)
VAGHICVDLIPSLAGPTDVTPGQLVDVGPLSVRLGGCVGNTGLDLAALGIRSLLVSSVGDDLLSGTVMALLESQRAADHHIEIAPGTTTSYSIVIQPPQEDRTFWHHSGSNTVFDGNSIELAAARVLHLGYLPLLPRLTEGGGSRLRNLLHNAHATAVTTSVDMCVVDPKLPSVDWAVLLRDVLPMCDILSPSADDLRSALRAPELSAEEAAAWLVECGSAIAMVTDGSRDLCMRTAKAERFADIGGLLLATLPSSWHDRTVGLSPVKGPVVETTGAGDAATAGLLAGIVRGIEFENTVELALAAAAHRVAGKGPLTGLSASSAIQRQSI